MRLVIDGQRLTTQRTGVGRCLEALLADWSETGWPMEDVLVVGRDRAGLDRVPVSPGVRVKLIGEHWPGLAWETLGLGRTLRRGDLLFAPANLVPLNWHGPTVGVLYDTLPWSVPQSFPWHVRLRFGWRYRLAARRATRVIVPSESSGREVVRVHRIDPGILSVAYPGPEPHFRPLGPDSPEIRHARDSVGIADRPFFLFVGKRSARRNVAAILRAFGQHRQTHPESLLVFVGPGGGERLPGPGFGVIDAGHVSEAVLHGLLATATALLYPSDHEGFGLPVVEAQACGCPVVTLRNSALSESAGEAAWFLASPGAEEILDALDTLAMNSATRNALVARGLRNVTRFSRRRFADAIKREIRQVAGLASEQPVSEGSGLVDPIR